MNTATVQRLILKDWTFNRGPIAAYFIGALTSILVMRFGGQNGLTFGGIVLLIIMLGMGTHMAIATIMMERSEKTLPFIMSLPVSISEFTMAKVLANLLLFMIPWLTVSVGCIWVILDTPHLANGLIPLATINLLGLIMGYVLLVGMAVVNEAKAWTIAGIILSNLIVQATMHIGPRIEGIRAHLGSAEAVWNGSALAVIGGEVAIMILALALTFYFQSRKKDFT